MKPRKLALLCYEVFMKSRAAHIKSVGLSKEVKYMFKVLKRRGVKTAVLTNGPSTVQWQKLHACKIAAHVDAVFVSGDLIQRYYGEIEAKPDPSIFKHVARKIGVHVSRCAMVGDSMNDDVLGAISAGYALALHVTTLTDMIKKRQSLLGQSQIDVTMRACMPEYIVEWLR
jgi:FMN phosphatase YigB (HAD superfamily)